jgi:Ubiquitin family
MASDGVLPYALIVKLRNGKTFSLMMGQLATVSALKQRIFEREGIPPDKQNLMLGGQSLQPKTKKLLEFSIRPGDIVRVTELIREPVGAHSATPIDAPINSSLNPHLKDHMKSSDHSSLSLTSKIATEKVDLLTQEIADFMDDVAKKRNATLSPEPNKDKDSVKTKETSDGGGKGKEQGKEQGLANATFPIPNYGSDITKNRFVFFHEHLLTL